MSMPTRLTLVTAATALALACALTGCSAPHDSNAAAPGASTGQAGGAAESPAASAAPTPDAPGLNTPVAVGSFEFTVLAASPAGTTIGTSPLTKTAQGEFFRVDLNVANTGDSSATFLINYLKLKDADGKSYDADTTAGMYDGSDTTAWITGINPGNAVDGPVFFDLPAGVTPTTLLVSDSMFGEGTPIRLG